MCKFDPSQTEWIAWLFEESKRPHWSKDLGIRLFVTLVNRLDIPVLDDEPRFKHAMIMEPKFKKCAVSPQVYAPELKRRYGYCLEHKNFVVFINGGPMYKLGDRLCHQVKFMQPHQPPLQSGFQPGDLLCPGKCLTCHFCPIG